MGPGVGVASIGAVSVVVVVSVGTVSAVTGTVSSEGVASTVMVVATTSVESACLTVSVTASAGGAVVCSGKGAVQVGLGEIGSDMITNNKDRVLIVVLRSFVTSRL